MCHGWLVVIGQLEVVVVAGQQASSALPPVHEAWLPKEHSLYRPRHGRRQVGALASALAFFCTPLLLLIFGVRPEAIENRPLTSFPSPTDGWGFFTGMGQWATDSLPLRGDAVRIEDWVSRNLFGESPKLGEQQQDGGPIPGPLPPGPLPPGSSPGEDRDRMRARGYPKVIEGQDGWYYLGYDVLGACLPDRSLDEVITALRRLRSVVESSGRRFVLTVAPDKTTMVPEHLPRDYVGAACAREAGATLWRRLAAEAGVVDLRPLLSSVATRIGSPTYSKVDSHWTYEGGLMLATGVAEAIRPGVTVNWRFSPAEMVTRSGDLPPLIGRAEDYSLQYYDLAPDGRDVRSRKVDSDFRQPLVLTQPKRSGVVDKSVGMIADSFSQLATPYLAAGFSDITVIHADTVRADPSGVGKILAGKDVIVVEAVQRSLAGGISAVVSKDVIDAIEAQLAAQPR
jgi:alginate O-acetyltransferase complex protein AlgJ